MSQNNNFNTQPYPQQQAQPQQQLPDPQPVAPTDVTYQQQQVQQQPNPYGNQSPYQNLLNSQPQAGQPLQTPPNNNYGEHDIQPVAVAPPQPQVPQQQPPQQAPQPYPQQQPQQQPVQAPPAQPTLNQISQGQQPVNPSQQQPINNLSEVLPPRQAPQRETTSRPNPHAQMFYNDEQAFNDYHERLKGLAGSVTEDPTNYLEDLYDKGFSVEQAQMHLESLQEASASSFEDREAQTEQQLVNTENYLKGAWGANFSNNVNAIKTYIEQRTGDENAFRRDFENAFLNPQIAMDTLKLSQGQAVQRQPQVPTQVGANGVDYGTNNLAETAKLEHEFAILQGNINGNSPAYSNNPIEKENALKRIDELSKMIYERKTGQQAKAYV